MTLLPNLAATLVAAAWQGIVLAAIVALCLRLLPNLSAALRSTVWLAVLATVTALHVIPTLRQSGPAIHTTPLHLATGWSLALVALWLAFSITRSALLLLSALHLRGVSKRAIPMETPTEIAPLLRAGRRSAQLCLSAEVDRPCVAGFFSPRILLPVSLIAKLSGEELTQIVLHEMQHLHRNDDWTNLAQKLALALFPLNPALLWIERRLCLERELACDDGVLRLISTQRASSRKAYATTLASLAEHSLVRRSASLALAAWERRSELATRVHCILFRPSKPMSRRQTAAASCLLTLTVLTAAATLAHAPQLVSFAPAAESIAEQHFLATTPSAPSRFTLTGAHASLVDAAMPTTPVNLPAKTRRAAAHRRKSPIAQPPAPFRAIQTMATVDPQPTPTNTAQVDPNTQPETQTPTTWIVLTRWEYIPNQPLDATPHHHRATLSSNAPPQDSAAAYAALPMPGGWLILQL